jgi:mono/diheme cytochrome c family protein
MSIRKSSLASVILCFVLLAAACSSPNPQPEGLTPIPSLAPAATLTLVSEIQGSTNETGVALPAASQDAAALGAPIFLKNCSRCHGIEGQGVSAPPVRNNQFIQTGADQDIFTLIANGRPGTAMPAWLQPNGGPLDAADITNVIAYLRTLQKVQSLPVSTPMPPEPTETPLPANAPTPEPARPSNPGGPGAAIGLTGDPVKGKAEFGQFCAACHGPEGVQGIPNPDSDDGVVPPLNPIDPTLKSSDLKVFASNIDLFIEHGSIAEGDNPLILMPSFGDSKMLTDQQIADLIAYVLQLNGVK